MGGCVNIAGQATLRYFEVCQKTDNAPIANSMPMFTVVPYTLTRDRMECAFRMMLYFHQLSNEFVRIKNV